MGDTKIEWTNKTWNPMRGCSVVSEGCRNCYAMTFAARFSDLGRPYSGLAYRNESGAHWTGKLRFVQEHLEDPLRWRNPTMIFVNSMSDLFHESVEDQWLNDIFGTMALAHWHTFQILTKRPERALSYISAGSHGVIEQFEQIQRGGGMGPRSMFRALDIKRRDGIGWQWPLPNVWLGVSVEDQKTADERIPLLMDTPAAVRWISAEPLLGRIDLESVPTMEGSIDWVVVGGESGPKARPMHPDWARSLRDQCVAAGVPFFFKQWGEFLPIRQSDEWTERFRADEVALDKWTVQFQEPASDTEGPAGDACGLVRVGKKAAGRLLDGVEWNEYPAGQGVEV